MRYFSSNLSFLGSFARIAPSHAKWIGSDFAIGPTGRWEAARVHKESGVGEGTSMSAFAPVLRSFHMGFEDDLRRVEERVAEARRLMYQQKVLIIRLRAAFADTWDAQRILWLLEANLRRFEEYSERLKAEAK
jgi:hypothetical protein